MQGAPKRRGMRTARCPLGGEEEDSAPRIMVWVALARTRRTCGDETDPRAREGPSGPSRSSPRPSPACSEGPHPAVPSRPCSGYPDVSVHCYAGSLPPLPSGPKGRMGIKNHKRPDRASSLPHRQQKSRDRPLLFPLGLRHSTHRSGPSRHT